MKISCEDEYKIVTIESKATGLNLSEFVLMCRGAGMALEYHPDSVRAQIPDEHELDKIVQDAVDEIAGGIKEESRYALEAVADKCREWKDAGCKSGWSKKKMLDIIISMIEDQD